MSNKESDKDKKAQQGVAAPRANYRARGAYYERSAAAYLIRQGYELLEKNYRCRLGEVDLIARDGSYIVFIEVKFRTSKATGLPSQAVDIKKQQRIIRVARWYLMCHGFGPDTPVRFDVIGICGGQIQLYKNAFLA